MKIWLPQKNDTKSHLPCSVWHRITMTSTKIVAVRATVGQILISKHIQIREIILLKMTCKLLKSDKNLINRSQFWILQLSCNGRISILNKKSQFRDNFCYYGVLIVKTCQKIKGWCCFLCTTLSTQHWVHKNIAIPLFFWQILTICTPF